MSQKTEVLTLNFNQQVTSPLPTAQVRNAIYSSCFLLIERMRDRLSHLDENQFPTPSTEVAREFLISALNVVTDSINTMRPSPKVLYERLISIRSYVMMIERSNSTLVSWPIACWFEKVWKECISDQNMQVFFAQRSDHNYSIQNFTSSIIRDLKDITTEDARKKIGQKNIYCLSLASLEEDNVPLYSNVGHEIGHIIFNKYETEMIAILNTHIDPLFSGIEVSLKQKIKNTFEIEEKKQTFRAIFLSLAKETTADVCAAILMGHSYILSMNEFSWAAAGNTSNWNINARNKNSSLAYPSFSFRLNYLEMILSFTKFRTELTKLNQTVSKDSEHENLHIENYGDFINSYDETKEKPVLRMNDLKEEEIILHALVQNWSAIMKAFKAFAKQIYYQLKIKMQDKVYNPNPSHIYGLLFRLCNNIPPNVIENSTMLGQPADIQSVILAACLYRQKLFVEADTNYEETKKALSKLDRLTSKAIEASFMQKLYNSKKVIK